MKKNTIILLLAISTLGLFVFCVIQQRRHGAGLSDGFQVSGENAMAQLRDQLKEQQNLAGDARAKYEEDICYPYPV